MKHGYDPSVTEKKWYQEWLKKELFKPVEGSADTYCIVIPPPNVTGILHIGHVLNNTLQDILIRYKRIQGYRTLWLPGTDHAGIATQNKVEQSLAKDGLSKHDLGRDAFVERVWDWKDKHGGIIIQQLKRLGCSCDWSREKFTMDPGLSLAVRTVFCRLFEKGLIYKGNYIVNWCPRCVTALSDEEVEYKEVGSHLWYIHYPAEDGGPGVVVATTRPETMLGDTGVAVHPEDTRYRHLIGHNVRLPLKDVCIPVVADEMVDREFGTGAVKITPAHDPNDFEAGKRHNLKSLLVIDEHGCMNDNAGVSYAGLTREECRVKVVDDLTTGGYLEKIEPYKHSAGFCYRCDCVIEPYLSSQWFVKMKPLAEPALRVVIDGSIRFYPDRWTKVYLNWLEGIRDWCISRQLWWGHRIPVWTCRSCGHYQAYMDAPAQCPTCNSTDMEQDPDVLDTWFSSWLWPFSTLGWPDNTSDLSTYYPTDSLITAPEIIFFWVARMIMAGLEFMGEIPFSKVYLHGTVRDEIGRKMSKSLGNSQDPLDIMEKYGADALRFSIVMISPRGSDIFFAEDSLNTGRTFSNKIWNASRLIISTCPDRSFDTPLPPVDDLTLADRWILYKLALVTRDINDHLEQFRFNDAAVAIHRFIWHELCDWYLEMAKSALYDKTNPTHKRNVQTLLVRCFSSCLQLLHPFMPFITEEIWNDLFDHPPSIMVSPWYDNKEFLAFEPDAALFDMVLRAIATLRTMRAEIGINPGKEIRGIFATSNAVFRNVLVQNMLDIKFLARLSQLDIQDVPDAPKVRATSVTPDGIDAFLDLEGIIDVPAETLRLQKEIQKTNSEIEKVTVKLNNPDFIRKAPAAIVEKNRTIEVELRERQCKLQEALHLLNQA
ncbi:valine--tRNA ligase [bacterium]|nr:valine--tRNA ligase [candidate division CSSED10-310 bacterium]